VNKAESICVLSARESISKEPVEKNVTDVCDYVQRVQDFLVIVCAKDCRNMGHGPVRIKISPGKDFKISEVYHGFQASIWGPLQV
jgi:hypothetical protein